MGVRKTEVVGVCLCAYVSKLGLGGVGGVTEADYQPSYLMDSEGG